MRSVLAEVTAHQCGMVTSAQAGMHGITRLDLSRLTDAGHFKRLAHGVHKDAGAPSDQFEDLRAAWLSTDPKLMAEARLEDRSDGVVVAGSSAALLHDIGDCGLVATSSSHGGAGRVRGRRFATANGPSNGVT